MGPVALGLIFVFVAPGVSVSLHALIRKYFQNYQRFDEEPLSEVWTPQECRKYQITNV